MLCLGVIVILLLFIGYQNRVVVGGWMKKLTHWAD
jgi:hypothetical protein